MDEVDNLKLIARLRRHIAHAKKGENERAQADEKGLKFRDGKYEENGIVIGKLPVYANTALTYFERRIYNVSKNKPIPTIQAVGSTSDDAAALLQSAIVQLWETDHMQTTLQQSLLEAGFTRPLFWYAEWQQDARGGKGAIHTRKIDPWLCIVDNRQIDPEQAQYAGFRDFTTRAAIMRQHPEKAKRLEEAPPSGLNQGPTGGPSPLTGLGPGVIDQVGNVPSLFPNSGRRMASAGYSSDDVLREEVEVVYLWWKDETPDVVQKVKVNEAGYEVYELVKDEHGNVEFEHDGGYDIIPTPIGPMHVEKLKPKIRPVIEDAVVLKYPYWRYNKFVPSLNLVLEDMNWKKPLPLAPVRDNVPLRGFWTQGVAQRMFSLQNTKNVLLSQIARQTKYGQGGNWMATTKSGIKNNALKTSVGTVYLMNDVSDRAIRAFTPSPVDQALFTLVNICDQEMMKLCGITGPVQGDAVGRVDAEGAYDKLMEAASIDIQNLARLVEETIRTWCIIVMSLIQENYTFAHWAPVMEYDGTTTWKQASALALEGQFDVHIETGSMLSLSDSALWARAKELYGMGLWPKPLLVKYGHVPHGEEGLKMGTELISRSSKGDAVSGYLLGAGTAPGATQAKIAAPANKRNHHSPMSGK